MGWLKKIFTPRSKIKYHVAYEESDILKLFEELEETYYKKTRLENYYKGLENKESDIKQYEQLKKEDLEKLGSLSRQYKDLQDKRQLLKGRLIKNNKSLNRLTQYEEDLPELIKELMNVDRKVKESERDIFYLSEERDELVEEREVLLQGYSFLKGFCVVFIIIVGLCILISFAMMQVLKEEIWVYLSGFACALVVFLAGVMYAKERIEKGLRNNEILQQKAAKYINKAKVRYFHNYRYIHFQFDKLGVDSVAKLEMYYNRYIKNKNNENDYAKLTKKLMYIETVINEIFKARGIEIESVEGLQEWMEAPKKAQTIKGIGEEKKKVLEQTQAMEAYESELWKEIFAFKEDEKYEQIIATRMEEYLHMTNQHLDKQGHPA